MKPIYKILGLGVLVVALVGAMWLAKSNQNIQRGAAYANVDILFLPDAKTVRVNQELVVSMKIDAKTHKLSGADVAIVIPNIFEIKEITPVTGDGIGYLFRSPGDVLVKRIDQAAGKIYLSGISMEMDEAKMATGVVDIARIKLLAKTVGNGEVTLDSSYANMLTGYNPGQQDQELGIGTIAKGVYTISGGGGQPTSRPTGQVTPTVPRPRNTPKPTLVVTGAVGPGSGWGQPTPTKKQTGCIVKPACVDAGTCPSLANLARRGVIKFCK